MSIAKTQITNFYTYVGKAFVPDNAEDGIPRFHQGMLDVFLADLLAKTDVGFHKQVNDHGEVWMFSFDDGSVLRFDDVHQSFGACKPSAVDNELSDATLASYADVLVRFSLRLTTLVHENKANTPEFRAALEDIEDAITNIKDHLEDHGDGE